MMERDLLKLLNARLSENDYSPVLIAGVQGSGKTTLGAMFAKRFAQSMVYDIAKAYDRQAFANFTLHGMHFSDLYLHRNRDPNGGRTLLFIDNVQAAPETWKALTVTPNRPLNLFILGASDGSLPPPCPPDGEKVNELPSEDFGTATLHPLSFSEFLAVNGEMEALESYLETPCPDHAHERLLSLFHRYVLVGGMPAAVTAWAEGQGMTGVEKAIDRILAGWNELLLQEAAGRKSASLASSMLVDAFPYAASRISFHGFANRAVRSREASRAFRMLESLMFLDLVHPMISATARDCPDTGRAPRLQFADTGMVIHFSGIRHLVSGTADLTQLVGGQVLRHIVGQEITSAGSLARRGSERGGSRHSALCFWVRDKLQSKAEVDFVLRYEDLLVPVVARAGEPGRLRSLHAFVDAAPHSYAVRLCSDRLNVRKTMTTGGKPYFLLSLPYYLAARIHEHLDGFVKYVERY